VRASGGNAPILSHSGKSWVAGLAFGLRGAKLEVSGGKYYARAPSSVGRDYRKIKVHTPKVSIKSHPKDFAGKDSRRLSEVTF